MQAIILLAAFTRPQAVEKPTYEALRANGRFAFDVPVGGEIGAEEVFKITNDPSRHHELVALGYKGPSCSVGDMVLIDGEIFFCDSWSWKKISPEDAAKIINHEAQGVAPDDKSLRYGPNNTGRGDACHGINWLKKQGVL